MHQLLMLAGVTAALLATVAPAQRGGAPADRSARMLERFDTDKDGVLSTTAFEIANTIAEETAPSPGAPVDIEGERLWPLACEHAPVLGQPRDIFLRLLRGDGSTRAMTTVSSSAAGVDDREPECAVVRRARPAAGERGPGCPLRPRRRSATPARTPSHPAPNAAA